MLTLTGLLQLQQLSRCEVTHAALQQGASGPSESHQPAQRQTASQHPRMPKQLQTKIAQAAGWHLKVLRVPLAAADLGNRLPFRLLVLSQRL
jgi:hypothetical protein